MYNSNSISLGMLRGKSVAEKKQVINAFLIKEISRLLRVEESSLDSYEIILDLDSLMLMRLINRVSMMLEIQIDPSELIGIFSHFCINDFVELVMEKTD